ncbi:TetR/AcrR family transcriptional regulator [Comamonas granuli]|uniref:TetR/AcrR family transcriptional regulator n=1 Tax=Comamonas granuli TaxID=290309 RepID=UPI0005A6BD19|nr:TetR/AcrR family transcriptional regulator [Comamonas granuli]
MPSPTVRLSFKEQMHQAREDAILQAACRLLGEKAYDAMTMDDVANAVGIAKASLYKHFASKEELCCAAMVQILQRVQAYLDSLSADMAPLDKLHALVRWSLERLLTNEMPLLPSRNSTLRAVLMANKEYLDSLIAVSDRIGAWITEAQAQAVISPALPPLVVLYTLYARACDPVVGFLKEGGQYSDAEIVDLVVRTCFDGLAARPTP